MFGGVEGDGRVEEEDFAADVCFFQGLEDLG